MNYEHMLVYIGSIEKYTKDGWEPTPGMLQVNKQAINKGHVLTYVWMRRVKS